MKYRTRKTEEAPAPKVELKAVDQGSEAPKQAQDAVCFLCGLPVPTGKRLVGVRYCSAWDIP